RPSQGGRHLDAPHGRHRARRGSLPPARRTLRRRLASAGGPTGPVAPHGGAARELVALEVLEVAAGGGSPLALILRARRGRPVRVIGGGGHPQERDLADL